MARHRAFPFRRSPAFRGMGFDGFQPRQDFDGYGILVGGILEVFRRRPLERPLGGEAGDQQQRHNRQRHENQRSRHLPYDHEEQ